MTNLAQKNFDTDEDLNVSVISHYDDFGVSEKKLSPLQREENVEVLIKRFFVAKDTGNHQMHEALEHEAIARSINPGPNFEEQFSIAEDLADGGFGPMLMAPSSLVETVFYDYVQTELGAVALAGLLEWDNQFIDMGWRSIDGALTDEGIRSYGEGKWRPFRVASNGTGSDAVTPSGVLLLPDNFEQEYYATGDISHPLAILHHEIKAHVLPLREAEGLVPGREMELICVRLESEMLRELGLPDRLLNWGMDDGTIDHTLHELDEKYYHGLIRYNDGGELIQIDPESKQIIGFARECE